MKEILNLLAALKSPAPRVLATLGKVEGSSYRRAGARLLWSPDSARVGSISGGCLEDDLIERARGVLASGTPQTAVYDTTGENDLVWGVGLGCHGVVSVLLETVRQPAAHWLLLEEAWKARRPVSFVTVISAPSAEWLGTWVAYAGADKLTARGPELPGLERLAAQCLLSEASQTVTVDTPRGRAEVFCEYLPCPVCLTIFGTGDDAKPLVRLAKELGWQIRVADPRPAYAKPERFPEADEVRVIAAEDAAKLPWDSRCVAVAMTHHYRYDTPILRAMLPLGLPYLGLLGPKKRAERILDDLAGQGFRPTSEMLARFHGPVGLDLGGNSPEEVAYSILAEIQTVLNRRDGRPLRERTQPIHG